jgi:hypothetical protein
MAELVGRSVTSVSDTPSEVRRLFSTAHHEQLTGFGAQPARRRDHVELAGVLSFEHGHQLAQ